MLDWAKNIAKGFEQERLTTGQIRRFFTEARRIEQRLRLAPAKSEVILLDVVRLAAIAEYACNRRVVPSIFAEFIRENVSLIRFKDDFLRGFLPHFECVLGYANLREKYGGE